MPLLAGAVSISPLGVATGVGLAKEIFDDYLPKVPGIPAGILGVTAKTQLADLCNSIAQVVVAHIVTNAIVTTPLGIPVTTAGTALAQTCATTAPGIGTVT